MAKPAKISYKLNLFSPILDRAVMLIGWALFLRIAYFFACTKLEEAGFFRIFFSLILPLLTEGTFLVLIRGLKMKNIWLYCVLSGVMCLLLMIQCFGYGNVLRTILGIIAYLACSVGPMLVLYGMIPKIAGKWVLIGVAILRFVLFNLIQNLLGFHWITLVYEISAVLELTGVGLFVDAFEPKK